MNHFKLRTLLITTLALGAAQTSLASGCRWPCDPPFGRNGWQPAATVKALPQTAAVPSATSGAVNETPSARSSRQPAAKAFPLSATTKARVRTASSH